MSEVALEALRPGEVLPEGSRVVVSRLGGPDVDVPPWAVVGLGRQDELLSHADLVICGGGHGMVSKTLLAGVPMVVVPGGGDQWEIANRLVRQGSAQLVRPLRCSDIGGRGHRGVVLAQLRRGRPACRGKRRRGGGSGTGVPRSAGAVGVGWIACG